MTIYDQLVANLVKAEISSPRLEARLILGTVLNKESFDASLLSAELSAEQKNQLADLVCRRTEKHEPLDKILGRKGFYKYDFIVNKDVLSPRPDTEILLEEALALIKDKKISVLDLGTGSGCILLSMLMENPQVDGTGVDISEAALKVASANAEQLGVSNRVKWINHSWFEEKFLNYFSEKFEIIVSNPPYIPDSDIEKLDKEVKLYDPYSALSGGQDGYDSYRKIAEWTPHLLTDNGYILLECGINQAAEVAKIFTAKGLELCKIVKDLQGIERCVILKK